MDEQQRNDAEKAARKQALEQIVTDSLNAVIAALPAGCPNLKEHFFYGAVEIAPVHLAAWYVFHTNADLEIARRDAFTLWIDRRTRAEMQARHYPTEALTKIGVSFTTDQDIKDSGLNFYQYFNSSSPIMHSETKPD
jgi:hypothetical protein